MTVLIRSARDHRALERCRCTRALRELRRLSRDAGCRSSVVPTAELIALLAELEDVCYEEQTDDK